jgi:hypothetical protein
LNELHQKRLVQSMQGAKLCLHFRRGLNRKKQGCRVAGQARGGEKEHHDQKPYQRDKTGEGAFADESEH